MSVGSQVVAVGYVIVVSPELAQGFNPDNRIETQLPFSSELSYLGGQIPGTNQFYTATFRYPKQTVTALSIGNNNGLEEYQINPEPLALNFDSPVEIEIINDIPDFTP